MVIRRMSKSWLFQHTAARRRLSADRTSSDDQGAVSTHSRPKAADCYMASSKTYATFQHTAARRRLNALILRTLFS